MHTFKEFQVLLFNTNNSIQHYSFVYTQLNGFKYCYVSVTIQLNNSHFLYTVKWSNSSISNNSISHSHLFAHSLNVKQFYLTIVRTLSHATTPGQSGYGRNGNEGVLYILQSFRIIGASSSDYLVSDPGHSEGVLAFCREAVSVFYSPGLQG